MKRSIVLFSIALLGTSCSNFSSQSNSNECIDGEVTFTKHVLPIFEQHCFSCHNQDDYARKADGNKMYSYDLIKTKIDEGLILGNIKHMKGFVNMPYRKKQLEECDILIIEKWIANGALED